MRLLVFDALGYFAHFRRIYSTTTSLTYSFPPRTSLVGMIAAVMGWERDSYYETMSSERAKIALSILSPVRKVTAKLNYLFPKRGERWKATLAKLMGMEMKTQITTELLVSGGLEPLRFRVFFSHDDAELQAELASRLREGRFAYPPSLGTANSLAYLEHVGEVEGELLKAGGGEVVEMRTVLPSRLVEVEPREGIRVMIDERVPAEIRAEEGGRRRVCTRIEDYVFEGRGRALPVRPKEGASYFEAKLGEELWRGMFL